VNERLVQARDKLGFQLEPALGPESPCYHLALVGRQVAEPTGYREAKIHLLVYEAPVRRPEIRRSVAVDDVDLLGVPVRKQGSSLERALASADDEAALSPKLVEPDQMTGVRPALG
jgi:hypothetical protein